MSDSNLQQGTTQDTVVKWEEKRIIPWLPIEVPVQETVQEAIPYTRIVQQSPDETIFTGSSYLRLGGYIALDEASLLPSNAKVTSTSATLDKFGSSKDYEKNSVSSSAKETSAQKQGNTQTQNTQKMQLGTPVSAPTDNRGILIYSDQDFRVNAELGGYLEFQKGFGVYVDSGDSNHFVQAGQLNLTSIQGITIQAGVPDYQATTAQPACFADINIISSNNISQKAYGPLDEITYGDSYKNVHGNSTELFQGAKQTWVLDAEVSGKMASSLTFFFGLSSTIKMAAELNATIGATASVKMSAEVSLSLTAKADFVFGIDYKMVTGVSTKVIVGQDTSTITSGLKTVLVDDSKFVTGIDFKEVTVDSKIATMKIESVGMRTKKDGIVFINTDLETRVDALIAKVSDAEIKSSDMVCIF